MLSSDFELPEEEPVTYNPFPMRIEREKRPQQAYDIIPEIGQVNGARLLDALQYDRRLAAVLICTRKNWKEILQTIGSPNQIKGVEAMVIMLRESLGLPVG